MGTTRSTVKVDAIITTVKVVTTAHSSNVWERLIIIIILVKETTTGTGD